MADARYGLISLAMSAVLVFAIELMVRGDFAGTVSFFLQTAQAGLDNDRGVSR